MKNVVLQTDVIITELALQYGLVPVYTIARNIPNKVMPLKRLAKQCARRKELHDDYGAYCYPSKGIKISAPSANGAEIFV